MALPFAGKVGGEDALDAAPQPRNPARRQRVAHHRRRDPRRTGEQPPQLLPHGGGGRGAEVAADESGIDVRTEAATADSRSEEHRSALQSLMSISYAVLCVENQITLHQLISILYDIYRLINPHT